MQRGQTNGRGTTRRRRRAPDRAWWYAAYRLLRISRREHAKAHQDVGIYGSAILRVNHATGEVEHIPYAEALVTEQIVIGLDGPIPTLTRSVAR